MSVSNSFIFPYLLLVCNCPQTQLLHGQGKGVVKQKVDRYGQGEGGGLITSRNVLKSFMDDPKNIFHSKFQ